MYAIYVLGVSIPNPSDWAPPVGAAVIAAIAALVSVLAATVRGPRDRRRTLYGDAFRDAMAWQEGLYRVRRRDNTPEHTAELVKHFHDLQERINHHRAWLTSESIYLAHSYCTFVDHVKGECLPLMQTAWAKRGRPPEFEHGSLEHPKGVEDAAHAFLIDVRLHLRSYLFAPWVRLAYRNRGARR